MKGQTRNTKETPDVAPAASHETPAQKSSTTPCCKCLTAVVGLSADRLAHNHLIVGGPGVPNRKQLHY